MILPQYAKKIQTLNDTDVSDPFGGDLDEYEDCAKEIYDGLLRIIGGL